MFETGCQQNKPFLLQAEKIGVAHHLLEQSYSLLKSGAILGDTHEVWLKKFVKIIHVNLTQ